MPILLFTIRCARNKFHNRCFMLICGSRTRVRAPIHCAYMHKHSLLSRENARFAYTEIRRKKTKKCRLGTSAVSAVSSHSAYDYIMLRKDSLRCVRVVKFPLLLCVYVCECVYRRASVRALLIRGCRTGRTQPHNEPRSGK